MAALPVSGTLALVSFGQRTPWEESLVAIVLYLLSLRFISILKSEKERKAPPSVLYITTFLLMLLRLGARRIEFS